MKATVQENLAESRWLVKTGRWMGPSTFGAAGDEPEERILYHTHSRGCLEAGSNLGGNAESFRPIHDLGMMGFFYILKDPVKADRRNILAAVRQIGPGRSKGGVNLQAGLEAGREEFAC